ncbi:MAG TPA: class I SAM-dependent methyltransferase [Puia sp.]|nr:class I SAM-dependent methyltransferase [Puia sp.]
MKLEKIKYKISHQLPFLRIPKRVLYAMSYYNKKYVEILKWGIRSKETANYTYDLTQGNLLYLAQTIAVVTRVDSKKILDYINEARNNKELKQHIIDATLKSPHKEYADLRVDFGRRLGWYAFARTLKPKIIVETGVDKGIGSVLLCSALLKNKEEGYEGHFFGTDINPEAGYLLTGKYAEVGEILYGDSIKTLSQFTEKIDLFINDSDHSKDYEFREYITIKDKISDKAVLLGDNSHISDKLAIFSNETNRNFLFFREEPDGHWYPGAGIGISFKS